MTTRTVIIKSDLRTADILYPEEARQQRECIKLFKQTLDTYVEANSPDRSILQSYSTGLSCLVTVATSLAIHLEMEKEDVMKLFTTAVEGNYEIAKR